MPQLLYQECCKFIINSHKRTLIVNESQSCTEAVFPATFLYEN